MVRFAKQNFTGTKHMASARRKSSSRNRSAPNKGVSSRRVTASRGNASSKALRPEQGSHFAVCVKNDDYRASLELRKLYVVLPDEFATKHDMLRVIDESGEDYLYPSSYFVRVELPQSVEQVLR